MYDSRTQLSPRYLILYLFIIPVCTLTILTGCRRYIEVDQAAQASRRIQDKKEAKEIINRVLSKQPGFNNAENSVVTDKFIEVCNAEASGKTTKRINKKIFYTTPTRLQLFRHKKYDTGVVIIWKNNCKLYRISSSSVQEALRFINAFKYMKQYNLKETEKNLQGSLEATGQ